MSTRDSIESTDVSVQLPGLVVRHVVAVGDAVAAGDALVVTETMKCESTVVAPSAGVVRSLAPVGDVLEPGEAVVSLDAPAGEEAVAPGRVRKPRPLPPHQVVATVCGPEADPRLGAAARSGSFVELDLAEDSEPLRLDGGTLRPSPRTGDRLTEVGPGHVRTSGVMVGVMTHVVDGHPDGVSRVWIGGDSSRAMGAVSEAECRRILAAIDLAEQRGLPLEWVAVSAGARIAWDTGTETMDWCAAVVARLVQFTQTGGSVVVIVNGVNVGAQSYWNAEATMLGHHSGMLVMVGDQAMVLTGKNALALSGGGKHRDDAAIGGYDQVMGPNGEAHHRVADVVEAYRLVFTHHSLCTRRTDGSPARVGSPDPVVRDVTRDAYTEPEPFDSIGEILEELTHPDRKQAFAMRPVMAALADRDAPVLERWSDMADAGGTIVWDTRLGGAPASVIGIESRPVPRDTGDGWLSGQTLHPEGSRKVAHAINAASGNRPVVVLANLAGFDGSARSMRGRQLEFGAEIARAVTNFEGPLVVAVLGRFHGGAYVVFSKALNPEVRIVALDGTYVSVIGGDSAAGVVMVREVDRRVKEKLASAPGADPERLRRIEQAAVAREFDRVHDVRRAAEVGSVDEVVRPSHLRETVVRMAGLLEPDPVAGAAVPDQARRAAASASARTR
ncbi:hypothetical protein KLP28_15005 [Nocardioidaceae bacterium]|nr:hypothetical protein KLP28_15005 [Nocardioidaceae bacterium]